MEPLVSMIIPIYNAQKSLERCLASIRHQTFRNFEVIMVNDGSQDHSVEICRKYAAMDSRFRLLDKENSGVSDSRNQGIRQARGKYLQFADSDDWLAKNAIEALVGAAEKSGADMVIAHFNRVIGKKIYIKGHIKKEGLLTREQFAEEMMKAPANFYYGVLWNKLYRQDIIRKDQILCPIDLNWCEDFLFNMEYLREVRCVYALPVPVYYYVKTKGSLVSSQTNLKQTMRTKKILFGYYKELYQSMDLYEDNQLRIQMFLIEVARDMGKRKRTK